VPKEKKLSELLKQVENIAKHLPKGVALEVDFKPVKAYDSSVPEGSEVFLRCRHCKVGGIAFATTKLYDELRVAFPDGWICNHCHQVNRWP